MGTGGPFPGVKRGRGVTLTTHPPSSANIKNKQGQYFLSPLAPAWRVAGQLHFAFTFMFVRMLVSLYLYVIFVRPVMEVRYEVLLLLFVRVGSGCSRNGCQDEQLNASVVCKRANTCSKAYECRLASDLRGV
jgi:hypothetical protein